MHPTLRQLIALAIVIAPALAFEAALAQSPPQQSADAVPPALTEAVQAVPTGPAETAAPLQVAQLPNQPLAGRAGPTGQPPVPVGPPFQLTPVQQQFVDQILMMWENESAKIKTFDCQFERWEYDPVFGPGANIPLLKSRGSLTYSKPDKGSFKIDEIRRWTQANPNVQGDWLLQDQEIGEHWVCDGKAVYEYKHGKKQLVVQPLPEDMRGKSIVDGPLPFLFGAEAAKLKSRYWMRSTQGNEATLQLEAFPRFQADAANYHHVEIMLERKTMLPKAIQVHMPNGRSRAVYMFENESINGKFNALFGALFKSPRTPLGWTRIVQQPPPGQPQASAPQPTAQR